MRLAFVIPGRRKPSLWRAVLDEFVIGHKLQHFSVIGHELSGFVCERCGLLVSYDREFTPEREIS